MEPCVDCHIFGVSGETRSFTDYVADSTFRFPEGLINGRLVANDERLNELVVQQQRSVCRGRVHQPKQENAFGQVVEGNPEEENVREELEEREESVGDPICKPFGIIVLLFAFNRFDGCISGVNKSNEVAKEGSAISNDQIQCRKRDQAQDDKEAWYFGFILKLGENVGEKSRLMKRLVQTHLPAFVG